MKVLVTGGAGFIGSHVADRLIEAGHEVVVVDNLVTGRLQNLNPRAKFYQVDIRGPELEQVFQAERPEVVDHHAAQVDVRRSIADPVYDAGVNVLGALNLLSLSARYGVRKVIHISSVAIYGEPVYLPVDEKHPIQPLSPYGATKYVPELYLRMYQQMYGLDYSIIRYANVYGSRQDPLGEGGVVTIFTSRMLQGLPVTIYGDGEQTRDFLFVKDCARANEILLEKGSCQVFNLGHGLGISVNQLFQELKAITGYTLEANYADARPGEIIASYLDAARARQELGWEPAVKLPEGLRETVAHFRKVEQNAK